jgi:hypothetical protein
MRVINMGAQSGSSLGFLCTLLVVFISSTFGQRPSLDLFPDVDRRPAMQPIVPKPNLFLRSTLFNFTDVDERHLDGWHEYSDSTVLALVSFALLLVQY